MPESKVLTKIRLHRGLGCITHDPQWRIQIAKLGSHQAIDGPSQRTEPVVPDPPRRNVLKTNKANNRVIFKSSADFIFVIEPLQNG